MVAESGRWSIEVRLRGGHYVPVCRADAGALRLFSEAPVRPACGQLEFAGAKEPSFAGVVARLKSGAREDEVERELAQTTTLHKGWGQPRVTALADIRTAPLRAAGLVLLAGFLLSVLAIRAIRMTAWVWAVSRIALSFAAIACIWVELMARAPFTETAGIPAWWSVGLYLGPTVIAGLATWWLRRDAHWHCRICYRPLAMPVSVGMPGRCLFEPGGVEHLCEAGHGSLLAGPVNQPLGEESWVTWSDSWA